MAPLLTLGWNTWVFGIIVVLFLLVSVVLVLTVLIQKPQGGGLSGAFGGAGAGSGQTAFGAKTGDALTVFTIIVFAVYILFAVVLNFATKGLIAQNHATPSTTEQGGSPPTDGAPSGGAPPVTDSAPSPAPSPSPSAPADPGTGATPPATDPVAPK
ncbi:MAG: hypothetical protein HBSAPP03_21260 [Phycisphaerae bacterium]|nr:MAG: hypothetical protein HBSAPP03_21260 [Phycisphaerae bacterium]